jgi:glyoxylase-like metal-dependent hydrolase (beta-lactamase superfamily II)
VLIDPGPPGAAATIISRAEEAGVRPQDVRLIFVTHGHLDHYGAAAQVQAWCGAPVSAYPGEPEFSQDRRNALPPAQTVRGSVLRWFYLLLSPLAEFEPLKADVLLQDDQDLSGYGVAGRTILLPGHSPGSLGIISGEGDAFVGDLFVNYTVPSQPMYLSDVDVWAQSYERVKAVAPRTVYVGHGEPFARDKLDPIYPARYQLRWWVR